MGIVLYYLEAQHKKIDKYEKYFAVYQSTTAFKLFACCDTIGFYGILHFTFIMALSRFIVIAYKKFYNLFQKSKKFIIILIIWSFTIGKQLLFPYK